MDIYKTLEKNTGYLKMRLLSLVLIVFLASGCSVNPNVSLARNLIKEGDTYFSTGEIDKSIEVWTKALKYGQTAEPYEKIVMSYIIKNQLDEAEKWVKTGLIYFPNNVNLSFDFALISFYKDDFFTARELADRVLKMNEYYRDAHYLKGLMYEAEGNILAAKREYVSEVNVNPGSRRAWTKLRELRDE